MLPRIAKIFENQNPDENLHNFSNTLYKIIDNYKTSTK